MTQRTLTCMLAAAILGLGLGAAADRIVVEGKEYTDVYIREGGAMVYVLLPGDGGIMTVRRDSLEPGAIERDTDAAARQARLEQWQAHRGAGPAREAAAARQAAAQATERPTAGNPAPGNPPRLAAQGNASELARQRAARQADPHAAGYVRWVKLTDVPLNDALRATLRSMNLDYRVEDGYIFVSSPELLRREASEPVATRAYPVRHAAAQTLPKIVLRGGSAAGGPQARGQFGGAAGGFGGFQGGGQAFGAQRGFGQQGFGGGFGQQGFGGMGQRGFGGGFGQQGLGGGFGQQGFGGMGQQGFGGGFGADVTAIRNISDLFSTIDDRLVGEPPAVIGTGIFVQPREAPRQR